MHVFAGKCFEIIEFGPAGDSEDNKEAKCVAVLLHAPVDCDCRDSAAEPIESGRS